MSGIGHRDTRCAEEGLPIWLKGATQSPQDDEGGVEAFADALATLKAGPPPADFEVDACKWAEARVAACAGAEGGLRGAARIDVM